jgi:uncharacterized membrane protein
VNARYLARAALYAAAYAGLTLAPGLSAIAYGPVQFRFSEALTVFACFDPAAVVGLTAGTVMWRIGPRWPALLAPVVVNGLGVAFELALLTDVPFWYAAAFVSLGEAVVLFTGGAALLAALRRHGGRLGLPEGTPPAALRGGDEARRTR